MAKVCVYSGEKQRQSVSVAVQSSPLSRTHGIPEQQGICVEQVCPYHAQRGASGAASLGMPASCKALSVMPQAALPTGTEIDLPLSWENS